MARNQDVGEVSRFPWEVLGGSRKVEEGVGEEGLTSHPDCCGSWIESRWYRQVRMMCRINTWWFSILTCDRSMRRFATKDNTIAKLVCHLLDSLVLFLHPITICQFAKHMKVEEQVKLLENKKTGIAVGTPARLMDLIENGMCSSSSNLIVV